jgi:hypothetical protein
MRALRSRIVAATIFALGCQGAVLGTPLAQSLRAATQDGGTATACACDMPGHENAMCPMHHSPSADKRSRTGESECRLSSAASLNVDFVLVTGTVPEPPLRFAMPVEHGLPIALQAFRLPTRSTALDPPPPRS